MTRHLLTAALLLAALPADAQVSCWRNYEQIFCSDGRSAIQSDDTTFWSDGTTVWKPDRDTIFITPPPHQPTPQPLDPYRSRRRPPG